MIPEWIYVPTVLLLLALILVCPTSKRGNGRYVSRKLRRLLHTGRAGAFIFQTLGIVGAAVLSLNGLVTGAWIASLVLVAWIADDALTGGPDDRDGRKHDWAKVRRLRMPKPVKLRLAERWAPPVPA